MDTILYKNTSSFWTAAVTAIVKVIPVICHIKLDIFSCNGNDNFFLFQDQGATRKIRGNAGKLSGGIVQMGSGM